jgi:hypothetical protein
MDWRTILLIEHIFIYWTYSYYLLFKYKIAFKYYIPSINVLFNILSNQIIGGIIITYFEITRNTVNITHINFIDVLCIILDIAVLYTMQYLYYNIMCKCLNIKRNNIDNYINIKYNIKTPLTTINCHILEHIFVNILSILIGTKFWNCTINSVIIWVWLSTFASINKHCNFKNIPNKKLKTNKNPKTQFINKKVLLLEDFTNT